MKNLKFLGLYGLAFVMASCGGNASKEKEAESEAANEAFYAEQPVESGMYDATYFNIKGQNPRKGQYDGRVIYALSPEQSAVFVYENGNRTKIKNLLMLEKGFQKTDSVYTATDAKGNPVIVGNDSTNMIINYIAGSDTISITFNPKAKNTYSPIEALAKIKEEASK
ncbi:MAG: hypothetical protein K2K25_09515 [Muribaculaceae bacterium]|nr:hypothetical protein [Muribaculaceae bacterium]